MENRSSTKGTGNLLSIVSIVIALLILFPILNWYFKITPFQRFGGLPLLIAPFISPIGLIFGVISIKVYPNAFGKWGIISNAVLFALPFMYWYLGIFIFGP